MRIVVALGGNALSPEGEATAENQQAAADKTAAQLASLVQSGFELAITHGNGPQIGNIILHEEAINTKDVPTMPVDVTGAMSQGQIGYWLQNAMSDQLRARGVEGCPVATIVTQVLVDPNDPAFEKPTKPIGPFYEKEEAKRLAKERGFKVREDSGRGWRRVIASPKPLDIIESKFIDIALSNHAVLIAGGGGGIPVYFEGNDLRGLEAVIDKDFTAAKLAEKINADILLILTAVDTVMINFRKKNEKAIDLMNSTEAEAYIGEKQFAPGSMLPKIEAAISFVRSGERKVAIITSPERAVEALARKTGTWIVK